MVIAEWYAEHLQHTLGKKFLIILFTLTLIMVFFCYTEDPDSSSAQFEKELESRCRNSQVSSLASWYKG